MRPPLHELRVYGTENGLVLDPDQETLIKIRGTRFKSYLEKFAPPAIFAGQNLHNLASNLRAFLANDFHMTAGMKFLIEAFYNSIRQDAPVPIPYREILLTARVMDAIFAQLDRQLQPARVE
jgi:predicted dehydrogenase